MSRRTRYWSAIVAVLAAMLGVGSAPAAAATRTAAAIIITGVDLHDGMLFQANGLYVLVGTQYGCGFQWGKASPWCGFAASTAPSLTGPWSPPVQLFSPSSADPFRGQTWQQVCGSTGYGCFNPRMVLRPDGVWVLWFNSPGDTFDLRANGYDVMGCAGPTGPCGPGAGPAGSYHKPSSYTCGAADGDFSILVDGTATYLECTGSDRAIYIEPLDIWDANGVGGGTGPLLANVEGPGGWRDPASGLWVSVVAYPECGFCAGTGAVYMTAPSPLGPWWAPANVQVGADVVPYARATISGSSCGGQPRTVDVLDGQPYEQIDLWLGTRGEAAAETLLVPLTFRNPTNTPGQPWRPFEPWACN